MSKPTWGLRIPGYSSPSVAQERAFAQMYPNEAAWHRMEVEQREREERKRVDEVRRRYRATSTTTTTTTTQPADGATPEPPAVPPAGREAHA